VLLNVGDAETVKDNIFAQFKEFCEDMGLIRVDEKFMAKTVKDVACDKWVVALDIYTKEESEKIRSSFMAFFGIANSETDMSICKTKKMVEIRDEYCLKTLSDKAEQEQCVTDTKESLELSTIDENSELAQLTDACWEVIIKNSNKSLEEEEQNVRNE